MEQQAAPAVGDPTTPSRKSLSEIAEAEPVINSLVRQWGAVEYNILESRKSRRQRVDTEALRASGKLEADEKFIGVRVIDNNIAKDIPPYISYLKQSRRQAIFRPVSAKVPADTVQILEDEYTRLVRYPGWEFEFIRWIDGAELHGFDWMEVLYDGTKAGKVAINHVGGIDLIFDLAVKDIQDSRMVLRRYKPTLVALDEMAEKNGFDKDVVKKLRAKIRSQMGATASGEAGAVGGGDGSVVQIYKVMYKERGIVFCAWWCPGETKTWLREPRVFWNGIKTQETMAATVGPALMGIVPPPIVQWVRKPETRYPYFVLQYKVTEDPTIAQTQGRGEMDLHIQEVSCSTWTAFSNMVFRSSRVMWSPSQPDPTVGGTAPKQLKLILKNGAIWDRPMQAFTPPPPDPMMPKALEMLATQNSDNINQPAWTVNNRQDSRKTATEVDAATRAQSTMSSVAVVTLSVSLLFIHVAAWGIVQSQILQGNIETPLTPDVVGLTYHITPAGDVDFIEKAELTQKMQQDWPVLQNTPAASVFLEEYIRVRYPNMAERFIEAIKAGDTSRQLIASMGALLKVAVTDDNGSLKPEWAQYAGQLQQIAVQAQQVMSQNGNNVNPGGGTSGAHGVAEQPANA
jgi:hypothetical protein